VSLIPVIQNWNNPNEDGFSFVPGFWASITMLPLSFFTLIGAVFGGERRIERARALLIVACGVLAIVAAIAAFGVIAFFMNWG
jgi:hypothetical protein